MDGIDIRYQCSTNRDALLIHGEPDRLVPVRLTNSFAADLEAGGHPVAVRIVPGADHETIYTPDVVGEIVLDWSRSLAGSED